MATLHLKDMVGLNCSSFGSLHKISSHGSQGTPYNIIPGLAKSL